MLKAFKYRIYPNKEQRELLSKAFGCSRWAYNWALAMKNSAYAQTGKSPSRFDLTVLMTSVKKEHPFLTEVSDWVIKEAINDVEHAFNLFFQKVNQYPHFKSKRSAKQSCRYRNIGFKDGRLKLPKLGSVRIVLHRACIGELKTCTVSLTPSGKYFASIVVEDGIECPPVAAKPTVGVGVDVGITHFCTLSTGEKIDNPKHLSKAENKLARAQRSLARKTKGSNRYKRAKLRVAKQHERTANQRKDFLHKVSKRLIDENQVIAVEDLNVAGMVKNHHLAKAIVDCSWSSFFSMLEYKASWYGSELLHCGRFEPSSKMCLCGAINHNLAISDRTWACPVCGRKHDRDILAAQNILKFAVASTVNGRGGSVRLADMLALIVNCSPSNPVEASSPCL